MLFNITPRIFILPLLIGKQTVVGALVVVVASGSFVVVVASGSFVVVVASGSLVVVASGSFVVVASGSIVVVGALEDPVGAAVVVGALVVGQHSAGHSITSINDAALREATQATKSTRGIFIFLCGFLLL